MSPESAAEAELDLLLGEGVTATVVSCGPDLFQLTIAVADQACAECLVPDETLAALSADALQRNGAAACEVIVRHEGPSSA